MSLPDRRGLPKPETRLQCVPDLRLRWEDDGRIALAVGEKPAWRGGVQVLEVLSAFAQPTTFAQGLQRLAARAVGAADWVNCSETVRRLFASGVLVDGFDRVARIQAGAPTFSGAPVHIRMLNDRVRTTRMIAAIQAEVRPGDVVVEVGTGTGVLAVAAARAGARHVYAIEAGAMAPVARELVLANGVADRVTVLEGWSQAVTLPERGDVFVSETIGNAGFDENIVDIARDAIDRLLKPGARMIPRRVRLRALPVEAPAQWLARQTFCAATASRWSEWYGIDFAVLPRLPRAIAPQLGTLPVGSDATKALGAPVDLAEADFFPTWRTVLSGAPVVETTSVGEWNAVRIFFEAELSTGVGLSTDPRLSAEEKPDSWANPMWSMPARPVQPGERWQIDFAWGARGRHQLTVQSLAASS